MTAAAPAAPAVDAYHGVDPGGVFAALRERAARRRTGHDPAADGRKIGLVIEGGGFRGVCSGGGIVALEQLGMTDVFDEVYGTSAGAMNAAYFMAGQGPVGIRIYYEDMIRREIVNPLRPWRILDIERLFQRAITGSKPLRLEAVLASRSRLHIAMIDVAARTSILVDSRTLATPEALLTALKASTAIPVLDNRRVDVGGRLCMDAGIMNPFPLDDAIAAGCTDILVLLSRPHDFVRPAAGRASRWFFDRLCARGATWLRDAYAQRHALDARLRDLAFGRASPPAGVRIATICTDDGEIVQRLTTDARQLHAAAVAFGRKTLRSFDADPDAFTLAPVS
jgi:predicted patatin/cPLA2 family phospholipase